MSVRFPRLLPKSLLLPVRLLLIVSAKRLPALKRSVLLPVQRLQRRMRTRPKQPVLLVQVQLRVRQQAVRVM